MNSSAQKPALCDSNIDKKNGSLQAKVIEFKNGEPVVSNHPYVTFIEGDGIGAEISGVTRQILDQAVALAYKGERQLHWVELFAGEKAMREKGELLPAETLEAFKKYGIGIKGPLSTPVGEGHQSLNVRLRQELDLYSCVRPVRYFANVPSPLKTPENVDIVIFRENTEDVYAGFEFKDEDPDTVEIIEKINEVLARRGVRRAVDLKAAIGIKPMTKAATERHMRRAIQYAIAQGLHTITIVHKANIMKFTEGGFRRWSYDLATREFRDLVVTKAELDRDFGGKLPEGKILINDKIGDDMLQQMKRAPEQFEAIVTPNLMGDLLSDDAASLVGGLGIAPGANIGDFGALFEATHGTAPDIMGKNLANPSSLILSGAMMLEYMGWNEAAQLLYKALNTSFETKAVTGDFRAMNGAKILGTKEFAANLVEILKR